MNRKFTKKEDIDTIIGLYYAGNSCAQIAKMYAVTGKTISALLKRNGVEVINKQNLINYTDEEIIEDYCQNHLSIEQISKKYKTSNGLVSKKLKARGIDVQNFHNKAKFNENIFDVIDTEEKAYWLGFIFADGYISSHTSSIRYTFELSLKGDDIGHLHKFNKFMEYQGDNVKLGIVKVGGKIFERCRWSVGNKHLWETLNSYGCIPQKSAVLKFPNTNIFKEEWLIIPFIRGYFDGDGCVSIVHKELENPVINVSMLGTKDFLTPISELFFPRELTKSHDNNDFTFVYSLSQKQSFIFLSIIYSNATIYLDRKIQRFRDWKNCRPKVKALGLLEGKFGESCDANPELTYYFKQ